MNRFRTFVLTFLLILTCAISAGAADKVTCYTMWDDLFFYAAFEVQDPDVISTNTTHMSKPWEDDCAEVYIETDGAKVSNRSNNTYQMSVSAGGGSSFMIGDNGTPKPKTIYTFKYSRRVLGTANRPNDKDIGYIVEMAIPWKEMGGAPKPGQVMGFNLVCRLKGENTGFVSLSPEVQTEDDINVPAKWTKIKFSEVPSIVAIEDGALVSRKVRTRAPLIDGALSANEWIRNLSIQMVKPIPPAVRPSQMYAIENLLLTHYFYWYQGDKRKEAPYSHIINGDGSDALTDHPADGYGFWLSHDRVQWHKDQLADIKNAGIDIIIPVYWGSTDSKKEFSSKGLNCLTQAMKEMKAEKQSYPLVGMFFDTSGMISQYGANPDLRNDEVKETFYGMIKDFFLQVPDEFRASVQLPAEKGGSPAYVVMLYTAYYFNNMDGSFVDYCNKRFAEDFDGKKLVWLGGSDFGDKNVTLDGYSNYGAGLGLKFDDRGWIDVAGIGAGYDDSAAPGRTTPIRSRMSSDTYKKDWDTLMTKNPNWVVVDGWNELHEGSDILLSREYGDRYVSLTRINALRFNGLRPYDAKYLRHDTPAVMVPGATYQVSFTIKNAGTKPWYPGQGIFLGGRWYKDGVLYSDSGARLPIQENVLAGQTIQKTMGIRAIDQDGKPLPDSEYELRWDMMQGRDEWFSTGGDIPLCTIVKISAQAKPGFTVVDSTLPSLMKSGAAYNTVLRIRNDGPTAWKANSKIGYRWFKASVHLGNASQDSAEQIGVNESAAVLPADVAPGRIAEITVPVAVVGADGQPLPVWKQTDPWSYILKWDVNDGEKWLASSGIGSGSESVKVTSTDYGPKFVSGDTPKEMAAGKKYSVLLTLQNTGTDVWTKADFKVGYHWCGFDGAEAVWDGMKSSLPKDVNPGETVTVKASVTAPDYNGQYYLIWDLAVGDKWASSTAITRGSDILMAPVNVSNGKLVAVDLAKQFDSDVVSYDINSADGNADEIGSTLPAELIPPFFTPVTGEGKLWVCENCVKVKSPAQRISFGYGSKADGAKNVVTCKGQTLAIKSGKYKAVHLLALSTQDASGDFGLALKGANTPAKVQFTGWLEAPKNGEHAGFVALHRNSPAGDLRGPAYINHYELAVDPASDLTGLALPNNPAVKILAITLEKAN
ncbi:MAG: sugar-binding protein [Armatimonadota bacterium]